MFRKFYFTVTITLSLAIANLCSGSGAFENQKEIIVISGYARSTQSMDKTLEDLFKFVKDNNAEDCLKLIVCQLRAKPNIYGSEGIRFGTSLLQFSKTQKPEAEPYRIAATLGLKFRSLEMCSQKYKDCAIDPSQLIKIGLGVLAV